MLDQISLAEASAVVASDLDMEATILKLRDVCRVDHLVYHSSKLGSSPSIDPYVRLTYPAEWIKRYLQMGYIEIDPVVQAGFLRTLPFDWSELTVETPQQWEFMADALAHGVGPRGLSVPVRSKRGHRALFSMSSSRPQEEWERFRQANLPTLIEIANRVHHRVIDEVLGGTLPHLTEREVECLRWVSQGKDSGDIAIILNISPHTARDYLKSVRYKLDCVTSAQAVSKAVKIGILVP